MAWPDLSDIMLRVRDRLNESSASFFSDAMIARWINDGENDICIKSLCLESTQSVTTTSGSRVTEVPCITPLFVEYVPASGTAIGLKKINPVQIGREISSTPATPQCWIPWGAGVLIDPKPAATYNLNVYTSIVPTVLMSDSTDEPSIPDYCHDFIIDYAVWRGLMRDHKFIMAHSIYVNYIKKLMDIRYNITSKYSNVPEDYSNPKHIVYKVR